MIVTNRTYGTTTLYCEKCAYAQEFEGLDGIDFAAAITEAKADGWKMWKVDDDWEHICPGCVEERE